MQTRIEEPAWANGVAEGASDRAPKERRNVLIVAMVDVPAQALQGDPGGRVGAGRSQGCAGLRLRIHAGKAAARDPTVGRMI
jgi:hypothetical protein